MEKGGTMRNVCKSKLLAMVCATVIGAWLAAGLPGMATAADAPGKVVLSNADCVKCHSKPVADIDAKGGKHKTDVGCQDCHSTGHPPTVKKIIPECSQCHQDKPHFKLKDCLGCHKNPHTPKVITFAKTVTDPCLTCHAPQIVQLRDNKSKHTALACAFCHDTHGKKPLCTSCHKSHSADIVAADCQKCHKPHMPKTVTYAAETPSKQCAACHKKAFDLLAASKAKHSKLPCTTCHVAKHKMVPKCQDCHGTPHPAGMMAKFSGCKECHYIAHDLNNLPVASEKVEAPAAKKAKKTKK
jgi:predicted CXXCH cytochrome family protein